VLNRALVRGDRSILILEDDMDWTAAMRAFSTADLSPLRETQWAFLHGGLGNEPRRAPSRPFRLEWLAPETAIGLTHFIGLRGTAISTARDYLTAMLARPAGSPEGGPMHVDGAYCWLRRDNTQISAHVCVPSLAMQRPSRSDIHVSTGWRARSEVQAAQECLRTLRKRLGLR
jgi:glycosyl transferase, family 25